MLDYDFNEYCCGCSACHDICPVGAISMKNNADGFVIPAIEVAKCIQCGQCERVCPHLNAKNEKIYKKDLPESWLFASADDQAKKKSSSGAAFFDMAKEALAKGFSIVGCIWNRDLQAEHIIGTELSAVINMQGSKYVQSRTVGIYRDVLLALKQGKYVLFSGTPCQCMAAHLYVKNYAQGEYRKNLYTLAVICHGVSTPKAWETFKSWLSQKNGARLIAVNFRSKDKEGYKKSYCRYDFDNGTSTYLPSYLPSSKYIEATLVYNLALRKSCSHCDCKGITNGCDVIIGDWYEMNTGKGAMGTSCIVAGTKHGQYFVENNLQELQNFSYEKILLKNAFIEKSEQLGKYREEFLNNLSVDIWNYVERLYPRKYIVKKLLCQSGLFDLVRRIIK